MIPFSIEEVRESSTSNVHKIMENCWNDGLSAHFEVKACLLCQSEKLLEYNSCRSFKDRVNARVNKSSMALSILLSYQNLVLYMEVRCIILKVDIFGYNKCSDYLIVYLCYKAVIS